MERRLGKFRGPFAPPSPLWFSYRRAARVLAPQNYPLSLDAFGAAGIFFVFS